MTIAIAFGGHGNNLLTYGKTVDEGESRLPDLRRLALSSRSVHEVFATADYIIGRNFDGLTVNEALRSQRWVSDTRLYQPLKIALDLALVRALEHALGGLISSVVQYGVGLSLGEVTALAAARTWYNVEIPLNLGIRRGVLILEHQPKGERMSTWALIRCGWEKAVQHIHNLRARHHDHATTLALTNDNATEIVLVAGEEEELSLLVEEIKAGGTRITPVRDLRLGAIFHHPSLKAAAHPFLEAVYESGPVTSSFPVLSNVTGEPHHIERLAFNLGEHLWHPVRFTSCVDYLVAQGVTRIVVIGGGAVVNLLQPTFGKDNVLVIETLDDVQRVANELRA